MSHDQISGIDMNKRLIVQTHIKAIMDLPAIAKENSIDLWRHRKIYAFQALKHPTTHWDDLLILILTSKLDSLTLRE